MIEPNRILIVDDHELVCDGLKALFARKSNLDVVGSAADGTEALELVRTKLPHLVLMDLEMPGSSGIETIARLKEESPQTKLLVLTFHREDNYVYSALNSGADGYVLKEDSSEELYDAIRSILDGKRYLSPSICGRVVQSYLVGRTPVVASRTGERLTERECEVLKLIAEGYRTREIASYLSLSPKTVDKHRTNLMRKLDLHSVAAVTSYAISNGLVA